MKRKILVGIISIALLLGSWVGYNVVAGTSSLFDAIDVGAILIGKATSGAPTHTNNSFVPLSVDLSGNLRVVDAGGGGGGPTTVIGNQTPADTFTNPTNALNTFSLLGGFNGTTWDRVRTFGNNADGLSTITLGSLSTNSFLYGFDGTNWNRVRVLPDNSDHATGVASNHLAVLAENYGVNASGGSWVRIRGDATNVDGLTVMVASGFASLATTSYNLEFDPPSNSFSRTRNHFAQATGGIVANGAGTTLGLSATPMSKHTMIVNRAVGATNAVEIDLECAISTTFVQIATVTNLAGSPVLVSSDGTPCKNIRYNVVTVGAGNTLAIEILSTR